MAQKKKSKTATKAIAKKPGKKPPKKTPAKASAKTVAKKSAKAKVKVPAQPAAPAKKSASYLGKKTTDLSKFISPLDDRVLVQTERGEKITAGGLIIPDTVAITGNLKAVVVAVGRGHLDSKGRTRPLDLKIGDRVLLPEHAGDSIQVLETDVKILRESEILGVLEK